MSFMFVIILFSVILICSIPSHKDILIYPMTLPTYLAFITIMQDIIIAIFY